VLLLFPVFEFVGGVFVFFVAAAVHRLFDLVGGVEDLLFDRLDVGVAFAVGKDLFHKRFEVVVIAFVEGNLFDAVKVFSVVVDLFVELLPCRLLGLEEILRNAARKTLQHPYVSQPCSIL
jgi:hypothetical protein